MNFGEGQTNKNMIYFAIRNHINKATFKIAKYVRTNATELAVYEYIQGNRPLVWCVHKIRFRITSSLADLFQVRVSNRLVVGTGCGKTLHF